MHGMDSDTFWYDPDPQCSCKLLPGRHSINLFIISAQICIRNSHTCCRSASFLFCLFQKCKYMLLYVCCHPAIVPHRWTIARPCVCVWRFVCALYLNCSIFLLRLPIHRIRRTFNHLPDGIFLLYGCIRCTHKLLKQTLCIILLCCFLSLSLVIC